MMYLLIGSSTMKKPRVEDFDPNSLPKLSSSMDGLPTIGAAPLPNSSSPKGSVSPTPSVPYAVRPVGRRIRRWPYELYEDQIEKIRSLAEQEKLSGGRGSGSAMVREAIDQWLERRGER
jgi:hypothetical protein